MQPGSRYEKDSETGARLHRAVDVLVAKNSLRLADLIERLDIEHKPAYYRIFQRASGPTDEEVKRLADAFGMTIAELWSAAD